MERSLKTASRIGRRKKLLMSDYLHSYRPEEQRRLQQQADFLRDRLHADIVLKEGEQVLEVGCGVGAQLAILARQPVARLVGVDRSLEQLARARAVLAGLDRVELVQAQGEELPFADAEFDQVLLFFVLEHVADPQAILREARRVLKLGGLLTVTEVNNPSLQVHPPCHALRQYWSAYNQLQVDLGGDPEVGIKLPNLALKNGFQILSTRPIGPVLDARLDRESRQAVVDFWLHLLSSVRDRLLSEGRIKESQAEQAFEELRRLATHPEGVIHYAGQQLVAQAGPI
jgi:SAM-dependent methyltransferase